MPFRNNILAGTTLVRDAVKSGNYSPGTSGWTINKDGTAEFNSIQLRGALTATNGTDSVVVSNSPNPRIEFYKSGVVEPALIVGNRPLGTGVTGLQLSSANTAGHTRAIEQLDEFGWRVQDGNGNQWLAVDPAESGVSHFNNLGAATFLPLLVKGKVGTGTTTTLISNANDTNISGANLVNVPVVDGRAYLVMVQLDYFRATTGALSRFQVKLWDGAVGGTQLGGTARVPMAGPLTTFRRTFTAFFVFNNFLGTRTISNMNLSMVSNDGTAGADWTTEYNSAYVALCFEIGDPGLISNL